MKDSNIFLSDRQIEILKLRKRGLTQKEISRDLKTTRENVSILESRAHRNVKRSLATLEVLDRLDLTLRINVPLNIHILDIPKIILEKADEVNIQLKYDCVDILERLKLHSKIVSKHITKPVIVTILTDGSLTIE